MGNTKALIVGVSKYFLSGANDLRFCKNDIIAIRTAFIHGLTIEPENIISCGLTYIVTIDDFMRSLREFEKITQDDDTLLFYFSGHGTTKNNNHYLVLSDGKISTQNLLALLDAIPAKNKVIFLDCCLAGNFQVGGSAIFDVESTASNFAGKGYAVFASSNSSQYSYSHPANLSAYLQTFCVIP